MLTFPLQCFLNDKTIFHTNFTCSLILQWKLLVMAKHGELFESKILVYKNYSTYYSTVPITYTQTRIHRTQSLHYDKLFKCSPLRDRYNKLRCNDISWRYIVLLCQKSLQRSLARTIIILARYRKDCTDIPLIYHFNIGQSMRCFPDNGNKLREQSTIFVNYRLHYFCTVLYCSVLAVSRSDFHSVFAFLFVNKRNTSKVL